MPEFKFVNGKLEAYDYKGNFLFSFNSKKEIEEYISKLSTYIKNYDLDHLFEAEKENDDND